MNFCRIIIIQFAVYLSGCNNQNANTFPTQKSDTIKIIELSIRTAFHGSLPDVSSVRQKYYFKDSILFTADSFLLSIIPKRVDTLKFKVLREREICSIIRADSLTY